MQRAYNRDGLPELAIGLTMLVFASLTYGTAVLPKRSPAFFAAVFGFAFGCPLSGLLTPRLVKWVRGRYLTDRFGYVRHARNKQRERAVLWFGILSAIVFACTLFLGNHFLKGDRWVLLLAGLVGASIQILIGWRSRVARFAVTGLFWALLGSALSLTNLPLEVAWSVWFAAYGLVELVIGGIVLRGFLVETQTTEGSDGN